MFTIRIESVYHSTPWTEVYSTRRAAKNAFRDLFKNASFGDMLTLINPAGQILKTYTR